MRVAPIACVFVAACAFDPAGPSFLPDSSIAGNDAGSPADGAAGGPDGKATTTLTFRDDGTYAGTQDTFISSDAPDANFGNEAYIEWDAYNHTVAALIRFEGIFGSGPDQVPPGATIVSANLRLIIFDFALGESDLYESAVPWDEGTVTYNNFGSSAGVQSEDLGADLGKVPAWLGTYNLDVKASVLSWQGGSPNNGWVIDPQGTSEQAISSEDTTPSERPALIVEFTN